MASVPGPQVRSGLSTSLRGVNPAEHWLNLGPPAQLAPSVSWSRNYKALTVDRLSVFYLKVNLERIQEGLLGHVQAEHPFWRERPQTRT